VAAQVSTQEVTTRPVTTETDPWGPTGQPWGGRDEGRV